ncbi:hypothetical protein GCM10020255_021150 [Rhodococcus baikonurensis]
MIFVNSNCGTFRFHQIEPGVEWTALDRLEDDYPTKFSSKGVVVDIIPPPPELIGAKSVDTLDYASGPMPEMVRVPARGVQRARSRSTRPPAPTSTATAGNRARMNSGVNAGSPAECGGRAPRRCLNQ